MLLSLLVQEFDLYLHHQKSQMQYEAVTCVEAVFTKALMAGINHFYAFRHDPHVRLLYLHVMTWTLLLSY